MEFNWECIPKNPTAVKPSESGVAGVFYHKSAKKWCVIFTRNNKKVYLGTFKDKGVAESVAIRYGEAHPWSRNQARHMVGAMRGGTSKYKGVSWNKNRKKWVAQLAVSRGTPFLGRFNDARDAAVAYDRAALELYGNDAYTNQMAFPEDFK